MATGVSAGKRLRAFWRNKVRPLCLEYEVPFFMIWGTAAFVLGYIGYGRHFADLGTARPPLDILYLTLQMFRMIYLQVGPLPWELELARWMAAFLIMYAALRIITALFREQVQLLILKWLTSGHVVICGANNKAVMLCEGFYEDGRKTVVIGKGPGKDMSDKLRELGAIVLTGDGSDRHTLARARIEKAAYLIALSDDDGENAAMALQAREAMSPGRGFKPLLCFVQVSDRRLYNMLKAYYEMDKSGPGPFRMEFFNAYDQAAGALLKEYPANSDGRAVIVGPGKLGESLLLRMAATWLVSRSPGRLRITIVDMAAGQKKDGLLLRYPILIAACDITAVDVDPKTLDPERISSDRHASKVYVCMDNDSDTLTAALSLRRAAEARGLEVIACMERRSGLSRLAGDIKVFEAFESAFKPGVILGGTRETLARAIHEEYVREQERLGITIAQNPSMAAWSELADDLRESNRHNVDHILVKLAAAGCGIELLTDADALDFKFSAGEIEKMARLEHERWVEERRLQGWTYGPDKEIHKKISPYMVPWEKLTEEIKEYDRNVIRGLPMFLAGAGFQIYRQKPAQGIKTADTLQVPAK